MKLAATTTTLHPSEFVAVNEEGRHDKVVMKANAGCLRWRGWMHRCLLAPCTPSVAPHRVFEDL